MVGWHHQLNGHEFEQAAGVSEGQGSLACCSSWGHKESDMTELMVIPSCLLPTVYCLPTQLDIARENHNQAD